MDNKKKPTTTLKEVRKRMKKMTIGEKKQQKEKETKEREKKEANKQKITQRVRVNVNVPSSYNPQMSGGMSGGFPYTFANKEHTTLLKSINEQLKKKNEPVEIAQNFNIPPPKQTRVFETQTEPTQTRVFETQTEPKPVKQPKQTRIIETQTEPKPVKQPKQTRIIETQTETIPIQQQSYGDKLEAELYKILQEGENLIGPPQELPPQFSEKISPPPIPIITTPEKKIPIVTKPKEKSSLSFIEQLKQKQEEFKQQEEKTPEDIEVMEEELKQERTNPKYKRLTAEEKKQKAEEKRIINQEKERIAEIEKRRKINEAENKKQQAEDEKKIITEKAFLILLQNVTLEEQKKLQESYDNGFLKDKEIKANLKKLKYTPEQIKRIFSKEQ